ncbi:putative metallophosphoesterase YunD [Oceanobacillus oncorhynchi subsp. incaldanensis]|uniref:Bifunctional metallophosphatase/5'-nucleotidase n=1 Tax=Oceanobacillus aidingensis TaxID=645964 RepID=A0ABV9JZJ1_9BACI|nr:bifunctional UDP-sugar hydrolase/5'-nucleotidase [Oceanobacillus oncorhynchi]MDM8098526.1 bifunctional UDP-sugar hydrolase/5'-nucleotidase [Oceanobacillus oncorhynchi]UUI38986.1 bifunctional metallophosphatase/5'-nucleotidase [Oceanobacillus oncorhynchi]GIO19225.1 putative metallophosphoesterase YunD [Oceanobacillus oncorhynchi subsp. incaldanensis]
MSEEKVYFYYTNDLHSHFEQWPRVTAFLKEKQGLRKENNEAAFTMDIGDHVDRSHPITEASNGLANVELLNEAGYDIVTLGNNEGITLSHQELYQLYDKADFQVVCSNLFSRDELTPFWLKRTHTFMTESGIRIGVLGLTAPFNAFYELLDWHVENEFDIIERYIEDLKKESDIIVLLSHLGISVDQEISRRYPAIDVIIGGHTHHLLKEGELVNQTLITAAGKHCYYIGEVELIWDHKEKKVISKEAAAISLQDTGKDLETEEHLQQLLQQADQYLGQAVASVEKPLEVNWFGETPIIDSLTKVLRRWTNADIAMLNAGVLLDSLPAGAITKGDIHRICPHPINPVLVDLKGDQIIETVRAALSPAFTELKLKGFGFRGEILGKMIFSGIQVETAFHRNGEVYVKRVYTEDGYPIHPDKVYYVATADTFTFGQLLPEIARSAKKQYFVPEFLRDLLVYAVKQH